MRKKGLNALELIFTLFVLIVVVLVVIRMFVQKMKIDQIKPVEDITESYNYYAALSECNNLCEDYTQDKSSYNALRFCQHKVSIDIDGDGRPGQEGAYGVLVGIPLCEDGIYCFHIKQCGSGTVALDAKRCLLDMQRYYKIERGLTEETANQIIRRMINYGTCEPDITKWDRMVSSYEPVEVAPYHSDWTDKEIKYMGPDYWWVAAGYYTAETPTTTISPTTTQPSGEISLSCTRDGNDLYCEWSNCKIPSSGAVIALQTGDSKIIHSESSSITFKNPDLQEGEKYSVVIACENGEQIEQVTW